MRVVRLLVATAAAWAGLVAHGSYAHAPLGSDARTSCSSPRLRNAEVVQRNALGVVWDGDVAAYGCSYRRNRIVRIIPKAFIGDYEGVVTAGLGPDVAAAMVSQASGACDESWVSVYDLRSGHKLAFVDVGDPLPPPPGSREEQVCGWSSSTLHIARDRSVVWAERENVTDAAGRSRSWGAIRLLRASRYRLTELDSGFDLSADVRLNRRGSAVTWSKAGRTFSSRL